MSLSWSSPRNCAVALRFVVPLAVVLNGCTAGSTGAPAISQVNPADPTYSKLQFSVGTANLYGTSVGLNVVSTLRQPNGASATGVNTPLISFPAPLALAGGAGAANTGLADIYATLFPQVINNSVVTGPSLQETSGATVLKLSGTSQAVHPGTPNCDALFGTTGLPMGFTACPAATYVPQTTTFGQSGGVFAMGLAPYNAVANTGQAFSYAPYSQPFFETNPANSFVPWGGPPAFDPSGNGMGTRDGLHVLQPGDSFGDPYFLGVAEGITTFEGVQPVVGPYQLAVQIGTLGNNGQANISTLTATAQLGSAAQKLPTIATPPTVVPDANGDGGATAAVTLPPGVTEALLQIVDYGPGPSGNTLVTFVSCQGAKGPSNFAPVYYTLFIPSSGTYQLPPTDGPNSNLTGGKTNLTPTPSLCTSAQNSAASATGSGTPPVVPADSFTVQMIGFDYPAYEAAVSLTKSPAPQAPTITGTGGQSDITISPRAVVMNNPGFTISSHLRRNGLLRLRR